jgi:hypothetical protein
VGAAVMNVTTYFVQNFLLPSLAAIVSGIVISILGGTKWSLKKHLTVTLPIIIAAFIICWLVTREGDTPLVVAGTIFDDSALPIAQATITRDGGSESCRSESNGNYRLNLTGKATKAERILIHVTKSGYLPYDASAEVPSYNFVIHLHQIHQP